MPLLWGCSRKSRRASVCRESHRDALLIAHIALCTSVTYVLGQEPNNARGNTLATITKAAFVADLAEHTT